VIINLVKVTDPFIKCNPKNKKFEENTFKYSMTAFLFDCPEKKINAADDMDYVICQYDYPFEIFVKKVNQKYYIFCYCFFFYYF
jgi:hypothetical protein